MLQMEVSQLRAPRQREGEDENDFKTILKLLESPEDPAMADVQGLMGFIDELSEHAKEGDYLENCGRFGAARP